MSLRVSIIACFILLRNNQPVRKALTMKLQLVTKKCPRLQLVGKGEAMFSDLNFYKIVKVKRKVNENVMIRILRFFIPTKNLINIFQTTPAKKSPAIIRHLINHLKGMGQLQFSSLPQNAHFHLNLRCIHAKYPTFNPCHLTIDNFIYQ